MEEFWFHLGKLCWVWNNLFNFQNYNELLLGQPLRLRPDDDCLVSRAEPCQDRTNIKTDKLHDLYFPTEQLAEHDSFSVRPISGSSARRISTVCLLSSARSESSIQVSLYMVSIQHYLLISAGDGVERDDPLRHLLWPVPGRHLSPEDQSHSEKSQVSRTEGTISVEHLWGTFPSSSCISED